MQRRAKSDAPGSYDETDVLTADAQVKSKSASPNKYNKASNKYQTSFVCFIIAFVGCLLLLDFFTPTPNVLVPNNDAFTGPTKSKSKAAPEALRTVKETTTTTPKRSETKPTGSIGSGSDVKYHIIFSTSCSTFQDWQSYVFFHEALVSGQPGTVTRIVSGCGQEDEMKARKVFQEQIEPMAPGRFKIHFTPDFATVKKGVTFPYFNKPFGTKHWLENAMGYPGNPVDEDSIVVLMDPDQLIIRPFENNDFSNERWIHLKKGEEPRTRIEHGAPMAQLYGFGLQWKTKVDMAHISPNEPSPVDDLTQQEAQGYAVSFRMLDVRYRYMQASVSPLLLWILMLLFLFLFHFPVPSAWTAVYCHGSRHVYDCRQVV
jgi:hypothetical protein